VARGWLARDPVERARIRPYDTAQGMVTIKGVLKTSLGHVMQLGTAAPLKPAAMVQNLTAEEFGAASGMRMLPFVLEQTGGADDRLVRDWPAPALGVDKHRGYAFQWYALAAMAFLFFCCDWI